MDKPTISEPEEPVDVNVDPVMIMKKRAAVAAAPKIMHLNVQ